MRFVTAAMIVVSSGCATAPAVTQTAVHAANPKIQIVFENATATDNFDCASGDKAHCEFVPPYPADRFQQAGTERIFLPSDCRNSFQLIQIENIDSKPTAIVVCAQPRE
jgi:hypothetical protein